MDICHIYTLGVSSNISHGRIKEATDTNLLKVAGSSETAHTLAAWNHLDSNRTTIPRLLAYCCLKATRERRQGFTQTTTKGDDYNYHKAKLQLSPRETHWQTLPGSLIYTAISFLRTLHSYFRAFPCNVNRSDPVLNVLEIVHQELYVVVGYLSPARWREHLDGLCPDHKASLSYWYQLLNVGKYMGNIST